TRIQRIGPGDSLFVFGDVALHGNRQLAPFTLALEGPGRSTGFEHPAVDLEAPLSFARALKRADTHVLVGGSELSPGISYGWRIVDAQRIDPDGRREKLAPLALNGKHFSVLGIYSGPLLWGPEDEPGWLELAQILWMDLDPGEQLVFKREILVGRKNDVASALDSLWPSGRQYAGQIDHPDAGLHVFDAQGRPLTFVRPDTAGQILFSLPPDAAAPFFFEVQHGGQKTARTALPVNPDPSGITPLGNLTPVQTGVVELPRGVPQRLIFTGLAPTPDPLFFTGGYQFSVGGQFIPSSTTSNSIPLAGIPDDPLHVELPPGQYRVLATRGPEWSVSETTLEVKPGKASSLHLDPLRRSFTADGTLSADFHVHAAPSDDSSLPVRQQVAAFVAMGTEVLVSTEHDVVFDYFPMIEEMGLTQRLNVITGVEVTSSATGDITPFTSGHANAFPLDPQAAAYRSGSPFAENRRLRDIIQDLRARPTRPILQLNHPREAGLDQGLGSYLTHLAVSERGFDPTQGLDEEPNRPLTETDPASGIRDFDFDAVELLNHVSMEAYRLTRADWFAWLLQGERRTATANSDSHSAAHPVGLPRNYVAYSGERGSLFDRKAFLKAVRAGRTTGSSGPWLNVRLNEAGPGDTHRGRAGLLDIRVARADWVPVDEIRVYVNGDLVAQEPWTESGHWRLPLKFEQDVFITVEAEGRAETGSVYDQIAPGATPFAFSNPIFVDADEQTGWNPPGLKPPLPATISQPLNAR
ncbi:CehA/McbA family metallohydrolase, partial [Myxococcota bacterium]|nr:CehA/McbA family metallohydrolase [Myxococcota bacterium]